MNPNNFSNTRYSGFYLASIRISVGRSALLDEPRLCSLAAEDACWSIALADWHRRRPRRWKQIRRHRWMAEGRALFEEQEQLRRKARRFGLAV